MDTDRRLTLDIINSPELHKLAISIGLHSADIVITSRINDRTLITRHIDLPTDVDTVHAIEEMVYDNPLLTADFYSVDIHIDNNRFFVQSGEDLSVDTAQARIDTLWSRERTGLELVPVINPIEDDRSYLVTAIERPLKAFVERTWHKPYIQHRLSPDAHYHALNRTPGAMGTIHLDINDNRLDIIAFSRDGLLLINTYSILTIDDAIYYTLAVMQQLEYDNEADRIIVSGDTNARNALIDQLRRYASLVTTDNTSHRP